jgi:hypothetical protein
MIIETPGYPRSETITEPRKMLAVNCTRCGGQGGYRHWIGYTCFRCQGSGIDPTAAAVVYPSSWSDEQIESYLAKAADRRAKAVERRVAKRVSAQEEQRAANMVAHPALAGLVEAIEELDAWARDIIDKADRFELSDRQVQAVADHLAAKRAEAAAAGIVEPGRRIIAGTIIATKHVETPYGHTVKMLLETTDENGGTVKLWGTRPAALVEATKGDAVTMTATVERSDKDAAFGFYSRPTKAAII